MTTDTTRAPSAHTDTLAMDRRAFIGAVPAVAAAAAVPALAAVLPDRSAWDAAMRTYQQAEAEAAAFRRIRDRIEKAWFSGQPSMDMIHWKEFWPANCRGGLRKIISS